MKHEADHREGQGQGVAVSPEPHGAEEGVPPQGGGIVRRKGRRLSASWPLLAACLALLLTVLGLMRASLQLTEGQLIYPLDDAYIHMAVARNLAEHGVWGVTRHGFSSSTSSLLWPLLLAGGEALVGQTKASPLLLSLIGALLCLTVASWALADRPAGVRLLSLVSIVFLTPLPTLVLTGMEHALHACATLLFATLIFRILDGKRPTSTLALAGAAALATSLRYESLFLVAAAGLVLALNRRHRLVVIVGAAALVAPLAYALVSVSRSWYPLPNSVILKGASFETDTPGGWVELLGGRSLRMLSQAPHVLVLVLLVLGLLAFAPGRPAQRALQMFFALTALLHMQFADTGWLYRYEAYLVALGLLTLGLSLPEGRRLAAAAPPIATGALGLLLAIGAYPLLSRAVRALTETPRASKNIFDQQYQMGLFLRRFYPGAAVVANDIGAISYLADVRLLDLYGLASMEVARARRAGGLGRETVARLAAAHRAQVVLIYRSWFSHLLPQDWLEVGSWRAPEQVVVAHRVVSFYALDRAGHDRLLQSLRTFQSEMPGDVEVRLHTAADEP
jgi:hypothetical protein